MATRISRSSAGGTIRDIHAIASDGASQAKVLDGSGRATMDAAQPLFDPQGARMAFLRNGNVFVRDLRNGALAQLTRSNTSAAALQWSHDGALVWRNGNDWHRWTARDGVALAASPRAEDDPAKAPKADVLRDPVRVVRTLRRERDAATRCVRRTTTGAPDPTVRRRRCTLARTWRSPTAPSPRWPLVAGGDRAQVRPRPVPKMKYITESGRGARGRPPASANPAAPQSFWLVDMRDGKPR